MKHASSPSANLSNQKEENEKSNLDTQTTYEQEKKKNERNYTSMLVLQQPLAVKHAWVAYPP